ncbi:hypothetical protein MASR2M117_12770 [Paludibacter sp.]
MIKKNIVHIVLFLLCPLIGMMSVQSQIIPLGSGSYTTTFPGKDVANRNSYPSGTPFVSGNAIGKPVPTSDWWSSVIKDGTASNLFNYPYTMKTLTDGLVVSYIPKGVIDDLIPFTVGVTGLNAPHVTVSDYSDWTVTMDWNDGTHHFKATSGVGMPFLYFEKESTDEVKITVNSGTVTISNEILMISKVKNGADFVVYAPLGSSWTQQGSVYTSSLNNKNYWSMAFIPLTASNLTTVANEYKKYAYVFPINTTATYSFNESTSVMRTDFQVEVDVKEGTENKMLLGLLPHQWAHLAPDSPVPDKYSYAIIRGEMKTLAGNNFSVENTFHGILPTLPFVDTHSNGFSTASLESKVASLENTTMELWTDSYNEGQIFNQLMQTARIANEMGNTIARDKLLNTIKTRLENWLKAESGEVAFLFYYNDTWSSLLGYPAGHGQDSGLNDKHFHWGYFIQAAAFVAQFQPGWASQWGDMVNMLVRDAAAYNRNDALFPYLRNFSPYAGHSWADGFANNPQGNNQESSSEGMMFNSSIILWGQATGNKAIRDLGIYLYTTEQTGIEEYFMDIYHRNFPASQQYSLVSRVWSNSTDNGTFWTGDIAASYGIELYPIHGGSFYLCHDADYVHLLWDEIEANTGIASNQANPNLWHDIFWEYLAFINPSRAIEMYDSYPDRVLKFGVSDAQTYHWLHAMNVLGQYDASITADYPIAAAFKKKGKINYVAQNYSNEPLVVTFSTGYQLSVPVGNTLTVSLIEDITNNYPTANAGKDAKVSLPATSTTLDGSASTDPEGKALSYMWSQTCGSTTASFSDIHAAQPVVSNLIEGQYCFKLTVTNTDGFSDEDEVKIMVAGAECSTTSTEASQGSFTLGYTCTYETVGDDVEVTFVLLDDKPDLIAYLWKESPFAEFQMTKTAANTFTAIIKNQVLGTTIAYACKFAFAGGMSVTRYISYKVGDYCVKTDANPALPMSASFYPNPVKDKLYVEAISENSMLTIVDVSGRILMNTSIHANSEIDVSSLKAGTYFIQVVNVNQTLSGKFIKM